MRHTIFHFIFELSLQFSGDSILVADESITVVCVGVPVCVHVYVYKCSDSVYTGDLCVYAWITSTFDVWAI